MFADLTVLTMERFVVFFFNDTATTEIYTLSLHDALPICYMPLGTDYQALEPEEGELHILIVVSNPTDEELGPVIPGLGPTVPGDRKSTRLNSSHANISYAVFCLKKKISAQTSPHVTYTRE